MIATSAGTAFGKVCVSVTPEPRSENCTRKICEGVTTAMSAIDVLIPCPIV